jgi:excisionase family DNA binding protein
MSEKPKITTISAEEAAKLTGLSKPTLYEGVRRGQIPGRIVGRRYIFVLEVLERWLQLED